MPMVEQGASTGGVDQDRVTRRGGTVGVRLGKFWGTISGPRVEGNLSMDLGACIASSCPSYLIFIKNRFFHIIYSNYSFSYPNSSLILPTSPSLKSTPSLSLSH